MLKDQIVFNSTISACGKGMFWTMVLHLLYQMQNTELRKNVCYYSMAITASGKASHWNIALKLLKEAKDHDGDVNNMIVDNTMFNACEKADQQSIELKTLVEHTERDNISFNSVSRASGCGQAAGKGTGRLPFDGTEKMHWSDSVLLNALRKKPAAASVLQQVEMGCAMEQELFQTQHGSILEHNVTAQQSPSSSHKNSMQVNTPPRRARMPEDVVVTVRPRLGMCAMISMLCKRDVPENGWEKHVKAERESEVKRMLEFELYEEVSEELTSGKRFWNSAWLDSQEKSGVARSALAENQISGACKYEVRCLRVSARLREKMRLPGNS